MRGTGTDGLVGAMKPGNAGGAKGPDTLAPGRGQPAMGGAAVRGKAYSSGSDAGNLRRCTGSVASRGESQPCLCTGSSAFGPRPECKSRMRRELHVRFCEGGGVRFPSATRLGRGNG
jgi:hypothetical protein